MMRKVERKMLQMIGMSNRETIRRTGMMGKEVIEMMGRMGMGGWGIRGGGDDEKGSDREDGGGDNVGDREGVRGDDRCWRWRQL